MAQLIASTPPGWTQTSPSLQSRIPKADPKKYDAIRDAADWKNPYLIVRRDGVEIIGMMAVGHSIPVDSVSGALRELPDSAWPYGLVVAVQDIGIVSPGDLARIKANRKALLTVLKKLDIAVELWPSAWMSDAAPGREATRIPPIRVSAGHCSRILAGRLGTGLAWLEGIKRTGFVLLYVENAVQLGHLQ